MLPEGNLDPPETLALTSTYYYTLDVEDIASAHCSSSSEAGT